jgi:TolB-like protein
MKLTDHKMPIWSAEKKELEIINGSLKEHLPDLEKELARLIKSDDENIVLLYSRRCLEVMITDLCECELKRPRKTEPLKGIIDKLNKEGKVPSHIIASMHGLNTLSTFGAHPKEYDPEQVKPVLNNLTTIIKWYQKYKNIKPELEAKKEEPSEKRNTKISTAEKSIIVLPFENMSPDPDQEYFSDGLTEEIITDLSHINDLLVISRSSAMTFKETKNTIKEIAGKVNVRYVLEGSVRKAGNNLRITAQLIDSLTDTHLWAEKYAGTLDDIFDVQEKVSRAITDALKIKLRPEDEEKLHERSIDNAFAYDRYLRAYAEILSWSKERIGFGLKLMEEGIEITGPNAIIYAGIALAYFQLANIGIDQEENFRKSEEFIQKALEINPDLPEAHFVYGNIFMLSDPHKAVKHYNKAYKIKPSSELIQWFSWCCFLVGKSDLAVSLIDQYLKLDPLNTPYHAASKGLVQFMTGHFDLALPFLSEAYSLYSEASMWQLWKALALLYNGKTAETVDFISSAVKEPGEDSLSGFLLFLKYALKGETDKMNLALTDELTKLLRADCQYSWHMASIYSYINDRDKSLEWLENAVNRGFINYPMLNDYDPLLENVRGEERFKKLMERTRFAWENFEV